MITLLIFTTSFGTSAINQTSSGEVNYLRIIVGKLVELIDVQKNILEQLKIISKEDCKWEKYSATYTSNFQSSGNTYPLIIGDNQSDYIAIPENQMAKEINVTNVYGKIMWSSQGTNESIISVNNIDCIRESGTNGSTSNYILKRFNPSCYSSFKPGLNKFFLDNEGRDGGFIGLKSLVIEMDIKPANC